MNLPNKITLCRIFLAFLFMFFLLGEGILFKGLALITFLLAAGSDLLDGFIARKYALESDLGRIMDPVADKVLVLAAFLAFVEMSLVPGWMVVVIVMRELLITGLRLRAVKRGDVLPAGRGGKHKTVSQMLSIVAILLFIIIREAGVAWFDFWDASFEFWYRQFIFVLMLITVILTVLSGISYLTANREYIFGADGEDAKS